MGWKKLKSHFKIDHIVQRTSDGMIYVGSPYITKLIEIHPDGSVNWGSLGKSDNEKLARYFAEMKADQENVKLLIEEPDSFEKSLPVWTYNKGEVVEKRCEEYGWPNITHDGLLMYGNMFFETREEALRKAICDASHFAKFLEDEIAKKTSELAQLKKELEDTYADLAKLKETQARDS